MKKNYEIVMGLEVHIELAVNSKLFCSCSAKFGADPNQNVCPACAGMPGMPAVANRRAIELGIAAAIVTNSEITREITFDKKNYFYPDLPTGYQITQWFAPICRNGWIEIDMPEGVKKITLKQIHIEEDAGKLVHERGSTLVDYNRAGVPLVEIVSNPDFRNSDEVIAYLERLRSLLTFAGISDCRMQEGSMRCDVNLSVREAGSDILGTRTEIKNMNSLSAIERAIAYESERHITSLETGCEVLVQETRRWDDSAGCTYPMRGKEDATDYRYFPNAEIMPVIISDGWIESIRDSLPEGAREKYARMTGGLGITPVDARLITGSKRLSDIFDNLTERKITPRDAASWIITELLSMSTEENKSAGDIEIDCEKFAALIGMVDKKMINRGVAKKILTLIYEQNIDPVKYAEENNLGIVGDTSLLEELARRVITENPASVEQYLAGSAKVFGFFMGKIMAGTAGKADPAAAKKILQTELEKLKNV